MKIKPNRFQNGGGFATFTPIIRTFPGSPVSSGNASEESGSNQSSILDEKMIEHLYTKGGLVNDVNKLVSELYQLEQGSNLPFLNSQNRSSMLQIVGKINEVNQNKKYWEDAISRAKESGGLGEVAVDGGRIFTKTKDNRIESMSLSEYSMKKDRVKPLSVQELMYERQYNPNLTGQNEIFTVADNAIGMNKITAHIKELVSALGKESVENNQIFSKTDASEYIKNMGGKAPTQDQLKSLSVLSKVLNGSSEYSQVDTKSESEKTQLTKALNYIWNTLGSNAQQKLSATAVLNGVKNPKEFIWDILNTNTDESFSTKITPIADNTAQGKKESTTEDKKVSLSPLELSHSDKLYRPGMTYEINNPSAGVSMKMTATWIGPLYSLNKSGEIFEPGITSSILNNYSSIVDPGKAYIGDSKIDPMMLRETAYTGEQVAKVYLPVNSDGSPDLAQMESFNKAYQIFDINKENWTTEEAEKYFQKSGFPQVKIKEVANEDGTVYKVIGETGKVRPFLALPIITNSASDISENKWMTEITGDKKDSAKLLMEEAFTTYSGTAAKPKSNNNMPKALFSWETPYKGIMFVAYRPESNAIISSLSGHLMGKASTETDVYRNLNFSSGNVNPAGIQSSSKLLNQQ